MTDPFCDGLNIFLWKISAPVIHSLVKFFLVSLFYAFTHLESRGIATTCTATVV